MRPPPLPEVLPELEEAFKSAALTALGGLLAGTADDLERFVGGIQADLLAAAAMNDQRLIKELVGQAETVARMNGLRIVGAGWQVVGAVLTGLVSFAAAGLRRGVA